MKTVKQQLYDLCLEQVQNTIRSIEAAIAEIREASQNETKSSMGDKYETAREMLQQDINLNMERLANAKADENVLKHVSLQQTATNGDSVELGNLVKTNNGWFYIAISLGHLTLGNDKYYAISLLSPMGQQLKGKSAGDTFTLNGKLLQIEEIL
jgi:transcription elongation GreA/GreB family factor